MCRVLRSRFPSSRLLCFYFCYSLPTFPRELFDNLLSWLLSPLGYMCRWTERALPVRIERMLSRNPSCLFFFFYWSCIEFWSIFCTCGCKKSASRPLLRWIFSLPSFLWEFWTALQEGSLQSSEARAIFSLHRRSSSANYLEEGRLQI